MPPTQSNHDRYVHLYFSTQYFQFSFDSTSGILRAALTSVESSHNFETSISQHGTSTSRDYTTHPRRQKLITTVAEAHGYATVRKNHFRDKFNEIRKIWVICDKWGKI